MALAAQQIATGDAAIVVAGGQESMTQAPHARTSAPGRRWATLELVDTMLKDGLWDAFHGYHMGTTAENVAEKYQITREQQDQFAAASQRKAGEAMKAGRFKDEIAPVTVKGRKGDIVVDDGRVSEARDHCGGAGEAAPGLQQDRHGDRGQCVRHQRRRRGGGGDVGARRPRKRGVTPLARIVSWATAGVDPSIMGTGPIPASPQGAAEGGLGRSTRST